MQLGEPKGKITEKNPKGYSKFQNKLLNYLNNYQNSAEASIQNVIGQDNFSSWKNGMCSFAVGNSTKQFSSITENQNRELVLTDPGPAVESELSPQYVTHSDNMSILIASVAMLSAQSHSINWMVDSGAGMSGNSVTNNLRYTMSCRIPITPAFGSVLNATAEGVIIDPTLTKLGIRAIHIDGIHHNLLSVHQVCAGGTSGQEQVGIFTSEGCQFSPLSACREALNIMSKCPSAFYGLVKGGVYVYAPHGHSK